jgi:hypothetical protein
MKTLFNKWVALSLKSAWATKVQIRSLSPIAVRRKSGVTLCEARVGSPARLESVAADKDRKKPEGHDLKCEPGIE